MGIGFLFLKILRFYVFKMAANGGRHFEINILTENYRTQFISQNTCKHAHTLLTNVIFVCHVNNHFMWLFYEYFTFIRNYWKKINMHCELVTSQPH